MCPMHHVQLMQTGWKDIKNKTKKQEEKSLNVITSEEIFNVTHEHPAATVNKLSLV